MTFVTVRTRRSEVSKDSPDDRAHHGTMTMGNLLVSYTKNVVGPTRCSKARVTLFRLRNQRRYGLCQSPSPQPRGVKFHCSSSRFFKASTFLREFVLGNNKTGLVTDADTPAVGGEDPQYAVNTLAEGPEIYQGSYTTTSTYHFPTETVARWNRYVQEGSTSDNSGSLAQNGGVNGKFSVNALFSVVVSSLVTFVWLC